MPGPGWGRCSSAFHGHSCPGLAIGIRAAELALNRLNFGPEADMVSVRPVSSRA
ncbi:MAG: formylmethanofuran dehydrogenase subunit E family protein [Desulfotignum sp.]|nr:formylmethanofuran dehydrogenase subunit E family protein [Desulfotignum sp.]